MKTIVRLVLAVILFAPLAAYSVPVTWVYEANVNDVFEPGTSDVAVGDRVTGTITFDADAVLSPGTITRTQLIDGGAEPHPFMNEVSRWGQATTVGVASILEVSFTVETAGGPLEFNSPVGLDVFDLLRHRENEFVPAFDAPDAAFDTFFATSFDQVTGEQIGMRLMTNSSPTGLFPLDSLLSTPPDLADLFLGRVHYTGDIGSGGETVQFFANFNRLELARSVPEPGSLALLGLGLIGIVLTRRRKQARETIQV